MCTIDGCHNPILARGLCRAHYLKDRRNTPPDRERRGSLADKFWRKVEKGEPGECWGWLGQSSKGYGRIHEGGKHSKRLFAHRVSYELNVGPIPVGRYVLHRCDNPRCTNPEHLFLGTIADNIADMDAKGRRNAHGKKGEAHPKARLTEADVLAIRASELSNTRLGVIYGVARSTVLNIRKRIIWSHIPPQENTS